MITATFDYAVAHSVAEAVDQLRQYGDDAKLLAGGQSLIPLMKFRLAQPSVLVDINRIPDLASIEERNGDLHIGALVREADLESSAVVVRSFPMLFDTSRVIADPIVRNLATVGGNIAHGDPANDHPAAMMALRASVVAVGPGGSRSIRIDDFFLDSFTTALAPDEMLTDILVPVQPSRSGGAYIKLERKVGDFAIVGVAAQVALDAEGAIDQAGIGLTNAGPTPLRAGESERFLRGKRPDEAVLREAGELAAQAASPTADRRGSVEYKRAMVRNLTVRALRKAVERAAG